MVASCALVEVEERKRMKVMKMLNKIYHFTPPTLISVKCSKLFHFFIIL